MTRDREPNLATRAQPTMSLVPAVELTGEVGDVYRKVKTEQGARPTEPIYRKVAHDEGWATQLWFIVCDEGWRESIVCERMYEWAAEWLLDVLGRREYAPDNRPGAASGETE